MVREIERSSTWQRIFVVGASLYVVLITVLSLVDLSSSVPEQEIPFLDKIVHFCFYFGMEVLLLGCVRFVRGLTMRSFVVVTLITIGYSVGIEVVQQFVGRDFDLLDICANSVGALCGLLFCYGYGESIIGLLRVKR